MRNRSDILYATNRDTSTLYCPNSSFPACSWASHKNVYLPNPFIHRLFRCIFTRSLSGKCRRFSRTSKSSCTCTTPSHSITSGVCQCHNRIIKGRLNIRPTQRYWPSIPSSCSWPSSHCLLYTSDAADE